MSAAEGVPAPALRRARFWRKLLRLTRGRVTLLRALQVAAEEETDPGFRGVIEALRAGIEAGRDLSSGLSAHRSEFSLSVIELVRTAEKTGEWDDILPEIAAGLEEGTFD